MTSSRKLLSILIPTYNRAEELGQLLRTLNAELRGLEHCTEVVICDNASTDNTAEVIHAFKASFSNVRHILQESNVGMDGNFLSCVTSTEAEYCWMIGDDDMPRTGSVAKLVQLLTDTRPEVVYLSSHWREDISSDMLGLLGDLGCREVRRDHFLKMTNVWVTFISAMILRRDTFIRQATLADLQKYNSTNLVHLGWVIPTIKNASKVSIVSVPVVLAKASNTGGYAVLKVFGQHFPAIIRSEFSTRQSLAHSIIWRLTIGYLPQLAWQVRTNTAGNFRDGKKSFAQLDAQKTAGQIYFFTKAIIKWPALVSRALKFSLALTAKSLRVLDRVAELPARITR